MLFDEASEEAEIRRLWQNFEETFFKLDAEGVSRLYAADADRINPKGEVARGRGQIAEQYAALFTDPDLRDILTRDGQHRFPIEISVRFIRPDVAILDGRMTAEEADKKQLNLFVVVLVKEQDRWWLAAGRDLRGFRSD
jgi:uncharacterized protein (TIGR02246 family)